MSNSKIKAAYFDIDGTLLGPSGELHPRTLTAINNLHERGILVGIATGRPWFGADTIAEAIQTNAPCMTFSGALLSDREKATVLKSESLQPKQLSALTNLTQKYGWYLELYVEHEYYVEELTEVSKTHAEYLIKLPEVASFKETLESSPQILKGVLAFDQEIPSGALEMIQEQIPGISLAVAYGAAHPDLHFVSITNITAKRELILDEICSLIDCKPEEIVSFGDGESDIPFLSRVGYGVAMGNANDVVKKAASFTTLRAEEQGVADYLEKYVLL